jgi:hypothetical protein
VLALVVVSATSLSYAYADTTPAMVVPSADDLKRVSANCFTIKSSLNQLHVSDALLRVNRGQIYESLSSKLMQRFNTRLTNNGLDAKDLIATTQNYDSSLTSFRSDYQGYEEQLSAAIAIDCTKQPANFYIAVQNARTKRNQVHSDVVALNHSIDDYSNNVDQFQTTFQQNQGAGH